MRAIWTGAISFGLINIPVRLYSATQDKGLDFDMLHKKDLSPIRYARVCRADGKEIPYEDIVKGYEYSDGDYVVLTEEDFKKANAKKTKSIEIVDFANEDEIDTIYYEKPYYLEPDKGAEKAYALLREAIKRSKKVGVAKFVLRNREHLGVIKPSKNAIMLEQLRFHEEIRDATELKLPKQAEAKGREIDMALALIDQLTVPFKPQEYKDEYVKELKDVIDQKARGKKPKQRGKTPQPTTDVNDIMQLLKASLQKQKEKVHA